MHPSVKLYTRFLLKITKNEFFKGKTSENRKKIYLCPLFSDASHAPAPFQAIS